MIENLEYKDWSRKFHAEHAREPIVMQIELTYRCPLHCVHCYSDCYNNQGYAGKELSTEKLKRLMDKLYEAKCLWLCFTGGDPMMRPDFIELYDYARDKGFILTIFTSLSALTDRIFDKFVEKPPFSIEMTLNAAREKTFDNISQVKGLFNETIANIKKIRNAKLPLKIKTMLTKNNTHETEQIRELIESFGCEFRPSATLFARLNGDTTPCRYRLPVSDLVNGDIKGEDSCTNPVNPTNSINRFFRCATGNWQWHIDPYGKLNICSCVREPNYDLLDGDVEEGVNFLSQYVKSKKFTTESACKTCGIWHLCQSCPGRAKLEVGDEEAPVPYFCELAKRRARINTNSLQGS